MDEENASKSKMKKIAKKKERKKAQSKKIVQKTTKISFATVPTRRKGYRLYEETCLEKAFTLVTTQKWPVRKAAKLCGVPEASLRSSVKRGTAEVDPLGCPPLIPLDEEKLLKEHIINLAKTGTTLTRKEILNLATNTAVFLGLRDSNNKLLSARWFTGFINRWPELKELRRTKEGSGNKTPSDIVVSTYFHALDTILKKYNLKEKPHLIFNFDETSFKVDCMPSYSVASPEIKVSPTVDSSLVTSVMAAGSAVGQFIPPYIICNGKKSTRDLKESLPGTSFHITANGCGNGQMFLDFLENHLSKYIPARSEDEYLLLLYHCHTSYVSPTIMEHALSHRVVLFALPPQNGTISKTPGISSFSEVKNLYLKEFQNQMSDRMGGITTRNQLCKLISKVYLQAFTPSNLFSAFRETGIYPLNRRKMEKVDFIPETLSESMVPPPTPSNDTTSSEHQEPQPHNDDLTTNTQPASGRANVQATLDCSASWIQATVDQCRTPDGFDSSTENTRMQAPTAINFIPDTMSDNQTASDNDTTPPVSVENIRMQPPTTIIKPKQSVTIQTIAHDYTTQTVPVSTVMHPPPDTNH